MDSTALKEVHRAYAIRSRIPNACACTASSAGSIALNRKTRIRTPVSCCHEPRSGLRSAVEQRTEVVLFTVLDRLYGQRNQLVHGGATWDNRVNRA